MSAEDRIGKVMLVSTKPCDEVKQCLLTAAGEVVNFDKGEDAILQAQRANFEIAVLVSTGKTMDIAETVFNLRDARPSMPIIIMATEIRPEEGEIIARACANTRLLTTTGGLS